MARLSQTFQDKTNQLPVKITLLLVSTLTVMAGATIAPSLPAMQAFFAEVPNADYLVRLALTLPALLIALGAPVVGVAIDRLGRKPLLLAALALYGIAGSSGFVLSDLGSILVGRAFLGVSVAGIMTIATTLVADYYSGSARAQFLGLQAGSMALGGVLFLTLGGFLADVNWRLPFLIYLMALVLIPFTAIFLPEPLQQRPFTTDNNPTQDESVDASQIFPTHLVVMTYGIALITQIVFYLIPTQLPFYLQQIANAGPSQSGLAIALTTLLSAVSSIGYRQIKARLGFVAIYGIAFVNLTLGYGLISWAISYVGVLVGLVISGIGVGLLIPNMNLCLTTATSDAFRGRVLSGITTCLFLGQFLSPLLSQPISTAMGLGAAYGLAASLMLFLTGATLVLFWRWR
ncbi:major facilitator superfamily protein [Leptolyngbya sp. Heron Island J]|uniref:MFS transporter n=1 Tax=Leptolyngbya sp. Heron Island J TaxID=1385935 RepID=UPI0003B9C5DD|nr:MFS transporter [Leptolyngbya sp. Heron Island J]ESA37976.1 major facilitator superfamily protein [Leptolyngbya sp. Heron Island J]